jgi:DNA-binding beta-propeller fold protein YncE
LTDRYLDLLVCNNYRHNVSRHIIQKDNGFQVVASLRLFEHDLRIPDSIAVSAGGDLVAVSNHERQRVDVFSNDAGSALRARPLFSLKVTDYPHGVRFGMDDRLILVADAGAPHVHVFARGKDGWSDAASPPVSIRVMDDDAFQRGRRNPQEGGPKGVDILSDGSLFVVSCEEVPIAFFDFRSCRDQLLGHDIAGPRPSRLPEAQVLDVAIATMKGQHEQILALRSEIAGLAKRHQARKDNPGRKLLSLVKRATLKALGSPGKG